MRLIPDVDYTAGDTSITLTNAISVIGTKVFFEALVNAATPPEPSAELLVGVFEREEI